jgi:hypothetical protein
LQDGRKGDFTTAKTPPREAAQKVFGEPAKSLKNLFFTMT